ncbi:MAG: Gfo/Idh/MocA family oxidoreductase [Alphaproteobacteria bacterium]|jgi:predicted dehydrogenase
MINAAVVGLGWWGKQIVSVVKGRSDRIDIVRGVEVKPDAVADFAAEKNLPLYTDFHQALDDPDIEAVILTTPHSTHEDLVLRAAAAGKQIFCEKPLALTADSAKRMVAACAGAGLVLGIGHERRFEPAMEELARMVRAGELGTILLAEAHYSHDKFAAMTSDNWRGNPKDAPAAGWTGMGIHLTDYLISVLGPIEEIRAMSARRVLDLPSGDVVTTQFTFRDGTMGTVSVVSATPFFGRMAIFGTGGWVEIVETAHPEAPKETLMHFNMAGGERQTRVYQPTDTVLDNLHLWADAVAGKASYCITDIEAIGNIAVMEALVRSTETGKAEKVDN